MTIYIESDPWPQLKPKILAKIQETKDGVFHCATIEGLRKEQGFLEALEWVLEEAKPPKPEIDDE